MTKPKFQMITLEEYDERYEARLRLMFKTEWLTNLVDELAPGSVLQANTVVFVNKTMKKIAAEQRKDRKLLPALILEKQSTGIH